MTKARVPEDAGPVEWMGPESPYYQMGGMIHCVRLSPEASLNNPAPVVLLLHGWGGDESSMWLFKQVVPARAAIITPRAPIEQGEDSFIWFHHQQERLQPAEEELTGAISRLRRFIEALPDLYPINPERLVIIGFSQGAAIGNSLVLARPGLAIGMASLSGFVPQGVESTDLAGLPVFIAHGAEDPIVPVAQAQRARDIFTGAGARVTYEEADTGHKVKTDSLTKLKSWLRELL